MSDDSGSPLVDVRLEALMGTLEDVREELHASLGEVRSLVEQSRQAVFRVESMLSTSDAGASLRVAERVENVHAIADGTRRRQSLLIGVVLAEAVMLAICLAFLMSSRAEVDHGAAVHTAAGMAAEPPLVSPGGALTGAGGQTLSSATEPTREPDTSAADTGKRRRNRRHH